GCGARMQARRRCGRPAAAAELPAKTKPLSALRSVCTFRYGAENGDENGGVTLVGDVFVCFTSRAFAAGTPRSRQSLHASKACRRSTCCFRQKCVYRLIERHECPRDLFPLTIWNWMQEHANRALAVRGERRAVYQRHRVRRSRRTRRAAGSAR